MGGYCRAVDEAGKPGKGSKTSYFGASGMLAAAAGERRSLKTGLLSK